MNIAWFFTSPLMFCRMTVLAWALTEEAVLLRTTIGGLVMVVWVTVTSRCRFRDRPVLPPRSAVPQFFGRWATKLLVFVSPVVVTYLLLAVLSPLQWTPLTMALANRPALRSMTFREWCRLVPPTPPTPTLLHCIPLLVTLQKWPTRPATAAPLVLAVFMKVIPRFGLVHIAMLRSIGPFLLQVKLILASCRLFRSRAQAIALLLRGRSYV